MTEDLWRVEWTGDPEMGCNTFMATDEKVRRYLGETEPRLPLVFAGETTPALFVESVDYDGRIIYCRPEHDPPL